jgi:hypothetical protein
MSMYRNGMSFYCRAGLPILAEEPAQRADRGNCVEVAFLPSGEVAMRNSRDPGGPALIFPAGVGRVCLRRRGRRVHVPAAPC